ncbi:MAG: hypothetical protein Q9M14_01195, partial [Mariprofundaceae bacterium]|nr:hypothetical protein [Mariprofundaceae bacterium]
DFMYEMNKKSIYQLIIIHNFHLLTDLNVISCLNEIEKYPYLSLLCVSEEKQQKSTLSAKDCILPWLTSKQLRAEINRRKLALEEDNMDLLIDFLLHQTSPYSWLDSKPESWFVDALWKLEVQQKS